MQRNRFGSRRGVGERSGRGRWNATEPRETGTGAHNHPHRSMNIKEEVKRRGPTLEGVDLSPKALSTVASPLKNDPMIKDGVLVDGICGMVEDTKHRDFAIDMSGFSELVRSSYNAQISFDRGIRKFISLSGYQYYCTILLWRRLWQIESERGKSEEYEELTTVLKFKMPVPDDIYYYLAGIGDLVDPSAREFQLGNIPDLADITIGGVPGSFGIINENSHIFYETTPSPFVAFWNMIADMNRTVLPAAEGPVDWDLPEGIRPNNPNIGLPTMNLLGYNRAVQLSEDQRGVFQAGGIYPGAVNVVRRVNNVAGLPINGHILEFIGMQLLNSRCTAYQLVWNESINGSLAQVPYVTRNPKDVDFDRFRSVSSKRAVTNSYVRLGDLTASGAAVFRYRIQRRHREEVDMLCYAPIEGHEMPAVWYNNVNSVFNFGDAVHLWNTSQFTLAEEEGACIAVNYSTAVRRRVQRT